MLSEKKGAFIMLPVCSIISQICHRFTASKRLRSHISHQTLSDPVPIRMGAGCHHHIRLLLALNKSMSAFILCLGYAALGEKSPKQFSCSQVNSIYIAPNHNGSYIITLLIQSRSKSQSLLIETQHSSMGNPGITIKSKHQGDCGKKSFNWLET